MTVEYDTSARTARSSPGHRRPARRRRQQRGHRDGRPAPRRQGRRGGREPATRAQPRGHRGADARRGEGSVPERAEHRRVLRDHGPRPDRPAHRDHGQRPVDAPRPPARHVRPVPHVAHRQRRPPDRQVRRLRAAGHGRRPGVLAVLVFGFGVPFLAAPGVVVGAVALLVLASIGIGTRRAGVDSDRRPSRSRCSSSSPRCSSAASPSTSTSSGTGPRGERPAPGDAGRLPAPGPDAARGDDPGVARDRAGRDGGHPVRGRVARPPAPAPPAGMSGPERPGRRSPRRCEIVVGRGGKAQAGTSRLGTCPPTRPTTGRSWWSPRRTTASEGRSGERPTSPPSGASR